MIMSQETAARKPLLLAGLDGSNPLGFLAALGMFRLLGRSFRMRWVQHGGTWVPAVISSGGEPVDEQSLLDRLHQSLAGELAAHPAQLLEHLAVEFNDARRHLLAEHVKTAGGDDRIAVDWLAALASDFAAPEAVNQLQTARRDYFLGNIAEVISRTTLVHLRRALFQPWDYADPLDKQSLHLDPREDRRHAHQWNQPSGDPDRKKFGGMLGANRLALEAIPLFTSLPERGSLRTTGFTGNRSTDTRWTWPIWDVELSLPVLPSLLTLRLLQKADIVAEDVADLRALGVVAVFRTRRILVGKTPNFTPARRIA